MLICLYNWTGQENGCLLLQWPAGVFCSPRLHHLTAAVKSGITMGCAISPILFVATFEVILIEARQMVWGNKLPSGQRLPILKTYIKDVTSLLAPACTSKLLKKMDKLMLWAVVCKCLWNSLCWGWTLLQLFDIQMVWVAISTQFSWGTIASLVPWNSFIEVFGNIVKFGAGEDLACFTICLTVLSLGAWC